MSPHPSYVMVSQPSPALPHTHSTNTNLSTPAPVTSNASGHRSGPAYYAHSSNEHHNSQSLTPNNSHNQVDVKPSSLPDSGPLDDSPDLGSDPDLQQHQSDGRPILETGAVVSAEVGAVPGILHQDLHPDGQPRRPMNAFMIFARHRRPAIQAKEPGLKTGEISKRLSHDWKNLPDEDKSHYLEQAKLLKDEFHSRFPEYVYKRRPNNTGKRRSSTSQQQLQPKFSCGPGGHPMGGGMPHPADMHAHHHLHHHHLQPPRDLYSQTAHSQHLSPNSHHPNIPPPRPVSSMTQPSAKVPSHSFYSPSANPSSGKYHHIAQTSSSSSALNRPHASVPATYPSRAPTNAPAANGGPQPNQSPRPGSPGPSTVATHSGISSSYMRLPGSHNVNHHNQPAPTGHYPWFTNDQHAYSASSPHQTHQTPAPLSANRSGFYYPSWPNSSSSDAQSISALDSSRAPDASDPAHTAHSRAASYSAGPPLYRPPSPIDRARQLSLPSHSLSGSHPPEGPIATSGSHYPPRTHNEQQPTGQSANMNCVTGGNNYANYPSPDVMSNPRSSYSSGPVSGSTFGSNSNARASIASGFTGHAPPSSGSVFDHHSHTHHQQVLGGSSPSGSSNHQPGSSDYANHCGPLHHPPPPQPPPTAATSHHQHPNPNNGHSTSVAASVAH